MTHDSFWRKAMGDGYREIPQGALTAIEQAALLPLCVKYRQQGPNDRYHAGVPVLREDGAAQVLPLTINRVEAYADLYQARGWSESFVLPPKGETV